MGVVSVAVKSYVDRIGTNWDELSPKQQSKARKIWNEHRVGLILSRIREHPEHEQGELLAKARAWFVAGHEFENNGSGDEK